MTNRYLHKIPAALATVVLVLTSTSAQALRCGQKLVRENMHETQVRNICGEPATARHIGYALRGKYIPKRRGIASGVTVERFPGYGYYAEEVAITEYIYNFGPRKLMRRLIFEGGVLTRIETIGYGYREKKSK